MVSGAETLIASLAQAPSRHADLSVGCLLGGMIGDALGTCCEGWGPADIQKLAVQHGWTSGLIEDFIPCIHMGQCAYVGPPKPRDEAQARCGMYSDDMNATLALATSLVEQSGLDGTHAARKYAEFFQDPTCPRRFCPPTAMRVMQDIAEGEDYRKTGLPPFFAFPGGSFANGGAMRSSPVGIAFRSAPAATLRRAAAEAIRSSHVHPDAVDAAALQAHGVAFAANRALAEQNDTSSIPADLLEHLHGLAETDTMRRRLGRLREHLASLTPETSDVKLLRAVLDDGDKRPGSGFGFQIASVDMMPCVFWIAARYFATPEDALKRAIAIGGDTDTTAMMVGCIVGAFHGTSWLPQRWLDGVENGKRGRDYAIQVGLKLAELSLHETMTWGGA